MFTNILYRNNIASRYSKFIFKRSLVSTGKSNGHYDIVIAGGGMVGTTLACNLGKNSRLANKRILLLEANKQKSFTLPEKYSNRVVSVSPGTTELLKKIGAWDFIEKCRYKTVKRLQVWDAVSKSSITFGEPDLSETISYIVENDVILAAVYEELNKCPNVHIIHDAKIESYHLPEYHESCVEIKMAKGADYTCALLLGCDGFNSQVRKAMQVNYISWSYNQMGVVATLKLSEKINNCISWQTFLPTGPIALLPLTDDLSSLVWSTTPEHAKSLLALSEEEFVDCLNKALWKNYNHSSVIDQITSNFGNVLRFLNLESDTVRQFPPKIESSESNRAAFPLGFGHSTHYIGKGVALVGDAAHRIHPLAGMGVNLGLGDVAYLNKVLGDAVYSGSTIDDLFYLKEYESERQKHNVPTMLACEGLHRLYNTDFAPLVILRSLGLQATHVLNPLKRAIISQASV